MTSVFSLLNSLFPSWQAIADCGSNETSGVIGFVEIWKIVRDVPLYAFKNIISWLEMLLFGLPNFSFFISIFVFR